MVCLSMCQERRYAVYYKHAFAYITWYGKHKGDKEEWVSASASLTTACLEIIENAHED